MRETLAAWQRDGVLRRDARPAFYALRQTFRAPDGSEHVRDGFFAALHLEDYERRIVRPHERTLSGPKADRLKLFRATAANLSSVFLLYEDASARDERAARRSISTAGLRPSRATPPASSTGSCRSTRPLPSRSCARSWPSGPW